MYIKAIHHLYFFLCGLVSLGAGAEIDVENLHYCDRIVGSYIDDNWEEVRVVLNFYQEHQQNQVLLNYFYHMISNCMKNLNKNKQIEFEQNFYLNKRELISLINPFSHSYVYKDLFELDDYEQEIQMAMKSEKEKILLKRQNDQFWLVRFLKKHDVTLKHLSFYAIILIVSTFCGCLCYSVAYIISLNNLDSNLQGTKQKRKAKFK